MKTKQMLITKIETQLPINMVLKLGKMKKELIKRQKEDRMMKILMAMIWNRFIKELMFAMI